MKREYVIDYEVWKAGNPVKWCTQTLTVDGDETPNAKQFTDEVCESAAEHCNCEKGDVRIRGIWRL